MPRTPIVPARASTRKPALSRLFRTHSLATLLVSGLGVAIASVFGSSAFAQTAVYWGNTTKTGNWTKASNWSGNTVPANSITTNFASFRGTGATVTVDQNRSISGLEFRNGATGAYSITATSNRILTLGSYGIVGNSTFSNTVGNNRLSLRLGAATSFQGNAGSLTIAGNVALNGFTLGLTGNGTGAYGVTSAITGSGSLNKTGTNTWTLSGANTYSGTTTVTSGNLVVSSTGTLGAATNSLAVNGGTLSLNNAAQTVSALSGTGGNIVLGSGHVLTVNSSTTASYAGNISGAGSLTKSGTGSLTLSGTNSQTGTTTVSAGSLTIATTGSLGAATSSLVINGGTVTLNNAAQTVAALSGTGGNLALGSSTALTVNSTATNTFAGNLTGTSGSSLNKTGSGTLTLSGTSSSYAGNVNITGGTVIASSAGALGGSSATTNVSSSGALGVSGGINLAAGSIVLAGSGSGSGALYNVSGNNIVGKISLLGDTTIGSTAGNLTLGNTVNLASTVTSGSTLALNAATGSVITASGVISDSLTSASLGIANTGSGTTYLTAANDYTGGTTVSAGNLIVTATGKLGATSGNLVVNGGTLGLLSNQTVGSLSGGGGTIALGSGIGLTAGGTGSSTFAGAFTGDSTTSFTKTGTGALTLSGASSSFAGNINITAGTLLATSAGALGGTSARATVSSGAAVGVNGSALSVGNLTLAGTGVSGSGALYNAGGTSTVSAALTTSGNATIVANTGSLALSGNANVTTNTTLSFDVSSSGAMTASGNIGGGGSIAKTGTGVLTLSGSNTYTGGTSVTAGTLSVASIGSLGSASNTLTIDGGTLQYTGASTGYTNRTFRLGPAGATLASTGSGALQLAGTIQVTGTGDRTLTLTGTSTALNTVSGAIGDPSSGKTSLTKTGTGLWVLAGNNSYTGTTTLSEGTLTVDASASLAAATSSLVVNGGTLNLNNAAQTVGSLSGNGGTIALGSAHDLTVNSSAITEYKGVFTGDTATSITKAGTGTLTLSGASSSFDGAMNVVGGTLIAANSSALGSSSATVTVSPNASLGLMGGITNAAALDLSGSGVSGNGALYNVSGTNTQTGDILIYADTTIGAQSGTLNLSGGIDLASTTTASTTLTFDAASGATINVTGKINDTLNFTYPLNVAQTGNGTVILANSGNYYYGNTTIGTAGGSSTGTLALGASNALPTRNTDSLITIYSGTLALGNYSATSQGDIIMGGGAAGSTAAITMGTGTLTLGHDVTYDATNNPNGATIGGNVVLTSGTHFFTVNDSSAAQYDLTVSAALSGYGQIDKYGSGTLLLTGNSSFTGALSIMDGVVSVQHNKALGSNLGRTYVNAGSTVELSNATNGDLTIAERFTLSGTGYNGAGALHNVAGNNTITGSTVLSTTNARIAADAGTSLTLSGNMNSSSGGSLQTGGAGTVTVSGDIGTGVTGITKQDNGTLILSGGNAFSGNVSVQGGVLSARSNTALGTNNTVIVDNGATLAFDNTGAGGNLATVNSTVVLNGQGFGGAGALRNTAGANLFNGSVSLASSSLLTADTGTRLTIGGSLTGNGSSTLTVGTATQNGGMQISGAINEVNLVKNGGAVSGTNGILTLGGGGSIGTVALNQGQISVTGGTLNTGNFTAASGTSLLIASGGTVNVTGDAVFNNNTINSASAGTLQISGDSSLTFNGSINASNLTLVLAGGSAGDNSAPVTVYLGGSNVTVGKIIITGDTILDFGGSGGTTLTSGVLDIQNPNAKIQVVNWVSTANNASQSTIWYVLSTINNGTLGGQDQNGGSPLDQITFPNPIGGNGNTTTWVDNTWPGWFDHEIRPTPEPGTYGAILLSACGALLGWHRYRRRRAATPAAS
ncbi:autotransporter-associated beta strand repeat-containing protein [Opitutus sp. ER46]|uniref:beta strand repeat-containing protein n=1 Tax=Opitutus sp. ER46 TaxID=2161864 RepID=UPI000D3230AF|nr:autotransporter-associated beta strand repeat-containing protein [Opitutus sp. ER46]PTX95524.1 hypothetical protein DB354_08865 [Opitutus sp. ER46]